MLPPVLMEGEFSLFNFWLDQDIQDGLSYDGELFCCICTVSIEYRAKLYHYACRVLKKETVVFTISDENCRLWMSLRSSNLGNWKSQRINEAHLDEFLEFPVDS